MIKLVQNSCVFNKWVCEVINMNVGPLGTSFYSNMTILHDFLKSGLQANTKCTVQNAAIPRGDSFKVWCNKVQVLNDSCLATECSILNQVTSALARLHVTSTNRPLTPVPLNSWQNTSHPPTISFLLCLSNAEQTLLNDDEHATSLSAEAPIFKF